MERGRAGFTLIEMLAVVTIFALLAGVVVPNLSSLGGRDLREESERLAGRLDLARQRAVMTGVPHRVRIDLEAASYALEWYASDSDPGGEEELLPASYDLTGESPLPLAAPQDDLPRYRPLPGKLFGEPVQLELGLEFMYVELEDGIVDRGEAFVTFGRDGTATSAEIWLDDDSGNELGIEVRPIADGARIVDEPL